MKNSAFPILAATLLAALSACGNLQGSPGRKGDASSLQGSLAAGTAASITAYYPADGAISAPPTTVNISFSTGSLDPTLLTVPSSYVIDCGGNGLAAQSVAYVPGLASVSVTLPTITGLANGTVCEFRVSNNLRDASGNFLDGSHYVRYTIQAGASAGGGGWVPASSATLTSGVGTATGSAFRAVGGPNDYVLKGLLVNGTRYADGVVGVWGQRFGNGGDVYGNAHGASAGGYTQLSCPAGYRVTGLHGRAGTYIDALGIVCKDESQGQAWRSSAAGGTGGVAFELSCPAGQFATDLAGHAGTYLNQLSLGCR